MTLCELQRRMQSNMMHSFIGLGILLVLGVSIYFFWKNRRSKIILVPISYK